MGVSGLPAHPLANFHYIELQAETSCPHFSLTGRLKVEREKVPKGNLLEYWPTGCLCGQIKEELL